MNFINRINFVSALTVLSIAGFTVSAKENIVTSGHKEGLKTTITGCQPAIAAIDLDINNVRARLMTGGDMWWNQGLEVAAYEIPRSSGKSSQFAASCWIGGIDLQGQLKVAAQTYRQDGNDYWPGALDLQSAKITSDQCANWDRFWKVEKSTINKFIELAKTGGNVNTAEFDVINGWPAVGNNNDDGVIGANGIRITLSATTTYAPFEDLNANGVYEPKNGSKSEYPKISGDQFIWWVFNDAGNVKQQTQTASMGIEVQTSAFAYSTQDFLNNATFYNYRVINRGALTIDSTYIAVWDDCDLGYYHDDYIGCDTVRGLGIMYNGASNDGQEANNPVNSYGPNPPQVGLDFFKGPIKTLKIPGKPDSIVQLKMTNFTYYNNDGSTIGNPTNGIQIYNYMTGSIRNGERFSNDFKGRGVASTGHGTGPVTNFVFTGDPGDNSSWSECTCGNTKGDRRFIFSSGPFQLLPGAVNDITFGCVWASGVGGCPNTDFKTIKSIDDGAQALFDAGFKTVEGPEAPRLIVRELDNKLIFYMVNDFGSNNYAENYGRSDSVYKDSLHYHQVVSKTKNTDYTDSLYRFEGYRVFQLANGQVTSAEIFDPVTGEVDNTKAFEVFQCDINNKVTKIINYGKVTSVSDSTWVPQIKVTGKDSGIQHSFVVAQDQFSTSINKNLINYHNYYYVAIAYAYNNFAPFDSKRSNNTQEIAYIGSAHGAGGINIPVVNAMPNPSNGEVGTTLNATFGSGVVITRVEGMGNGGNVVDLNDASTQEAIDKFAVGEAVYKVGQGPITVKIVDPVKVPAYDWVFQIKGSIHNVINDLSNGTMDPSSSWVLMAKNGNQVIDTIYGERNISTLNEQIIEKYGISISLKQVKAPGIEQDKGNGYISSSIEFENTAKPWLWGVPDQSDSNFSNWIRSGNNKKFIKSPSDPIKDPCQWNDNTLDTFQAYQNMLPNFTPAKSTWAPYNLAAYYNAGGHSGTGTQCGFEVAYIRNSQNVNNMTLLPDVNIVFTSDRTKWTKCAVIEEQEDTAQSKGHVSKFYLRAHAGWTGDCYADGSPVYSAAASDYGTSYFPGYAIDQQTGQRLNIVFGEDSHLSFDNGDDMIWNPSSNYFSLFDASIIFGGKHIIYVLGTKYNEDKDFIALQKSATSTNHSLEQAYDVVRWVGLPIVNFATPLLSAKDGLIPTKTTLKFRVTRPYAPYAATDTTSSSLMNITAGKAAQPYYTFSTKDYAPTPINDATDRNALLDKIKAVPNPYYGYSGYESNRYETKVKIINLPARATISIYSLDGTLVRILTKSDPEVPFIDWDVHNAVGLPIASGMYLLHVKADGIGETVIKWFGAMRPIDATSY